MRGPLRPLVGFLSAVVAAILLCASNHADAQAPPEHRDYVSNEHDIAGDPIHDLGLAIPSFTNPYMQGIALRTQWDRVEPHEHANANDFYWDYLDQGVALAAAHGKKVSIIVQAGVETPLWVYDAGAPAFYVTEQFGYSAITDGVTTAGSTTVISAGDTADWDPDSVGLPISGAAYRPKLLSSRLIQAAMLRFLRPRRNQLRELQSPPHRFSRCPCRGTRYFSRNGARSFKHLLRATATIRILPMLTMGGPGRRQESYFCFTPYDMDYFNNTLGGLPNWERGVKWIIDQYGTYFPNTPFILAMAAPIPTTDGDDSLKAVGDYGVAQYPGNHFGVMSCGLQYPTVQPTGQWEQRRYHYYLRLRPWGFVSS